MPKPRQDDFFDNRIFIPDRAPQGNHVADRGPSCPVVRDVELARHLGT